MGTIVFSIDAELGWGFADRRVPPTRRIEAAPAGWRTLVETFEDHEVPATWAVVGHLFLRECDERCAENPADGIDHQSYPRAETDGQLGPELVDAVRRSPVAHEVACHSFSHVRFDEVSRSVARNELERSVTAAASAGVSFDSFVFPRNGVGHRDLLAEFGFRAYRGERSTPDSLAPRVLEKVMQTAGHRDLPLSSPTVDEFGLVDVPPSLYLFGFEGLPRRILTALWDDPVVRLAKRGIDRAVREDGVCHFWLHPNNLRTTEDCMRVQEIVAYAADRRDRTDLTVATMAQVADRVLEQAPADVHPPQTH